MGFGKVFVMMRRMTTAEYAASVAQQDTIENMIRENSNTMPLVNILTEFYAVHKKVETGEDFSFTMPTGGSKLC